MTMTATNIAARQASLLEKMAGEIYTLKKILNNEAPHFDTGNIELLLVEMDELDKLKKEAIVMALWNGVKGLNRLPENDFEAHYSLEIQIIGAVKAWRMITGDDLKTSANAVKAIREEIYNGTIKFPFI